MAKKSQPRTALAKRFLTDLQLSGKSPKTVLLYTSAIRELAEFYDRSPDRICEDEVRDWLLHLTHERKLATGTMAPKVAALKIFYSVTVPRKWKSLSRLRVPRTETLPEVLSVEEVRTLLSRTRLFHYHRAEPQRQSMARSTSPASGVFRTCLFVRPPTK